jgi:hypothetical protein
VEFTYDELPKLAELGCEGTIIGKVDLWRIVENNWKLHFGK